MSNDSAWRKIGEVHPDPEHTYATIIIEKANPLTSIILHITKGALFVGRLNIRYRSGKTEQTEIDSLLKPDSISREIPTDASDVIAQVSFEYEVISRDIALPVVVLYGLSSGMANGIH